MIGLFLVLLAALLFAQSWYLLGLYSDARTFGLIVGALALGIAASALGSFEPVLLTPDALLPVIAIRGYILLWAVYGAVVAAHGLWGYEERAIGYHALFLWAVSMIYVILPWTFDKEMISNQAAIVISGSSVMLSILSAMVFFHLAVPFRELRTVAGWFLLIGSVFIAIFGLSVFLDIVPDFFID